MAVRLHLKLGQVPEADRIESSVDAILVEEPTIGSISRSKGNLYAIVTARPAAAGHLAEATALVAEVIKRQYYYDESAGIPVCLEKAIRAANQRLRHGREGHALARGVVGAVVAVARGHELYVATTGDADAYLVRQARLLTLPDENRGPGLPDPDDARVDVWRGDLAVGDTLILAARSVTAAVGADELKNAAVTLHPQSAAEHLHHLFVAAGGVRSDGLLVLEANEVAVTRSDRKLVPVRPAEPLAGAPDRSPIPLADAAAGAAAAVQGRAREARAAAGGVAAGLVDRLFDLMPQRRAGYRRVVPLATRQESQRRAAMAVLGFLGVVLALGVAVWVVGGLRPPAGQIGRVNAGEQAVQAARTSLQNVFGQGDLIDADRQQALADLRSAWTQLGKAASLGVPAAALAPLRAQAQAGLDRIYQASQTADALLVSLAKLDPHADLHDLVVGPDGAAYLIDRASGSLIRVDLAARTAKVVVKKGDLGIAAPWAITSGGPDVLILDSVGALWRWRPSDAKGDGTLAKLRLGGSSALGHDVNEIASYVRDPSSGLSFFYAVDPAARAILRYSPAADGSGYPSDPSNYLAAPTDVSGFLQLYIDGDVYVLTSSGITQYQGGQASGFSLETPPDNGDVRPGHDYEAFAATGARGSGRLWVWDAKYARVLAFSKADGSYLEQFRVAAGQGPAYAGVRAMIVIERASGQPPVLVWESANALYASPLAPAPGTPGAPSASPSPPPTPSPTPRASSRPGAKGTPRPSPTR